MKEDGSEYEYEGDGSGEEKGLPKTSELAELSLNLVVGLSSPKTMKLRGSLQKEDVIVFIDSGASHNFVSLQLVNKLGLNTEETRGYGVIEWLWAQGWLLKEHGCAEV